MRELPLVAPMSVADISKVLSIALLSKDSTERILEFTMADERSTRYDFFIVRVEPFQSVLVASLLCLNTRRILLRDILAVSNAYVAKRPDFIKQRIRSHYQQVLVHNKL